jgi:hypothetical protein
MTRPDPIRNWSCSTARRIVFTWPGDEGRRNASVVDALSAFLKVGARCRRRPQAIGEAEVKQKSRP